ESKTASPPSAVLRAAVDRRRRISLIWAIPVITLLIGGWLAWQTARERGPLITITFQTAAGLTANQSHVRHKDVDMGVVQKIALTPDRKQVQVTVRMTRDAEVLLTQGAEFWVVRPRFFAGSISGLQTLVSGSYIDMRPGLEGADAKREFAGLENPPVLQSDVPGRTFLLKANRLGSLSLGSPVMYRDLDVGEVLGWDVGEMARDVTLHVFVREPFDKYVHDDSRFWNASGASVQLGANGVQFQIESLRAILLGGIAFETPDDSTGTVESAADRTFTLYQNKEAADASVFKRSLPFVTNMTTSVSGLGAGSPVTLHGIKVGEVSSVTLLYNRTDDQVVVPVHFTLEPGRIAELNLPAGERLDGWMEDLVKRGLRVKMETANFLTGQKQLVMDMFPDAAPGTLHKQGDAYVIPAEGGGEDIATAAGNLVSRLNSIPFQAIGDNLNRTLQGASALTNNEDLTASLTQLRETLEKTQSLVTALDKGATPALQRLPAIANGLEATVRNADKALANVQASYGGDSRFNRSVDTAMAELAQAARSIRVLADLLSRHPEALIRGRAGALQ
ncbi:MAG: MCE family protein, partial [Proteobacteria bacterium]|nr:MCE family protein [Pseudomonadota bacterium]